MICNFIDQCFAECSDAFWKHRSTFCSDPPVTLKIEFPLESITWKVGMAWIPYFDDDSWLTSTLTVAKAIPV